MPLLLADSLGGGGLERGEGGGRRGGPAGPWWHQLGKDSSAHQATPWQVEKWKAICMYQPSEAVLPAFYRFAPLTGAGWLGTGRWRWSCGQGTGNQGHGYSTRGRRYDPMLSCKAAAEQRLRQQATTLSSPLDSASECVDCMRARHDKHDKESAHTLPKLWPGQERQ